MRRFDRGLIAYVQRVLLDLRLPECFDAWYCEYQPNRYWVGTYFVWSSGLCILYVFAEWICLIVGIVLAYKNQCETPSCTKFYKSIRSGCCCNGISPTRAILCIHPLQKMCVYLPWWSRSSSSINPFWISSKYKNANRFGKLRSDKVK